MLTIMTLRKRDGRLVPGVWAKELRHLHNLLCRHKYHITEKLLAINEMNTETKVKNFVSDHRNLLFILILFRV